MKASKDIHDLFQQIYKEMNQLMEGTLTNVDTLDPETTSEQTIGYLKGYNAAVVDMDGIFTRVIKDILAETRRYTDD